jgi:U4/U6.U5 tri-snRNP-associated protein 2
MILGNICSTPTARRLLVLTIDLLLTMNGDNSKKRKAGEVEDLSRECPYLDTINRSVLDFDFEPSCSVSLETGPHVYGCLVCGKFFRGRGQQTPAYTHSVDDGHFIFVHLQRGTFHCLPDDYEVKDPSLADISAALHPTFDKEEISKLDANTGLARDLFGRRYLPGFVGMNNLAKTDCVNAVVQALAHVRPLRDFFLSLTHDTTTVPGKKPKKGKPPPTLSPLVQAFGELMRKMWSDKRFKSHVDPHMLIQAISVASNKKYRVGHQAEAGELTAWLLNQLHLGLGGTRKPGSSIIHDLFQGKVQVTTRQKVLVKKEKKEQDEDDRLGSDDEAEVESGQDEQEQQYTIDESTKDTHFLQLTLDIAEKPLFRDAEGGLVIPQEPLVTVLKKFDGMSFADVIGQNGLLQKRRYRLLELPKFLILHLARFQTTRYSQEKNPTIVLFPVKNLDMGQFVYAPNGREKPATEDQVRAMKVSELKALLTRYGRDDIAQNAVEKPELVEKTIDFVIKSLPDMLADKYDLVANIIHDSPADVGREGQHDPLQAGSYKCHVQHRGTGQWYEMQDLHVQETMPQLIGLSESLLLIFERKGVV